MTVRLTRLMVSSLAIGVIAFGVPAAADAAHKHRSHHRASSTRAKNRANSSNGSTTSNGGETALTGTTLSSATAAAIAAVPGGSVDRATTETDGTGAYEVFVTKTDGSRVKVIEDSAFAVLSTDPAGGGAGGGCH
jgi:hypothetical protein